MRRLHAAGAQPVGPRPQPRRLERWLGRGRRGRRGDGRDRVGHRRLDPDPGVALRPRRREADVRTREPRRRAGTQLVARSRGATRTDRRGRGPAPLRPRRAGRSRPDDSRLPAAPRPARERRRDRRPARRGAAWGAVRPVRARRGPGARRRRRDARARGRVLRGGVDPGVRAHPCRRSSRSWPPRLPRTTRNGS